MNTDLEPEFVGQSDFVAHFEEMETWFRSNTDLYKFPLQESFRQEVSQTEFGDNTGEKPVEFKDVIQWWEKNIESSSNFTKSHGSSSLTFEQWFGMYWAEAFNQLTANVELLESFMKWFFDNHHTGETVGHFWKKKSDSQTTDKALIWMMQDKCRKSQLTQWKTFCFNTFLNSATFVDLTKVNYSIVVDLTREE